MNVKPIQIVSNKDKIEFDSDFGSNQDPYIIVPYGPEGVGKTRLALSGPSGVGVIAFEMKSYQSLKIMEARRTEELGKPFKIFKPSDPSKFLVNSRYVDSLDDAKQKEFYKTTYQRAIDTAYGLLENSEVKLLMMDKFSTFCRFVEFGINGPAGKKKRIGEKVFIDKSESNQEIADLMGSLSQFKKPVVLVMEHRDEYIADKPTGRIMPSGYKFVGSHSNLMCQLESNPRWNPSKTGDQYEWKYALSVRTCQINPNLEGPEGHHLLRDDFITLPNLIMSVDPDNYDGGMWE